MASDENQPTTISAALSIIDAVKRERDEARVKYNAIELSWGEQLHELKALCREAADAVGRYELGDDLYKRLREAGGGT
jgi:hypothetical protein